MTARSLISSRSLLTAWISSVTLLGWWLLTAACPCWSSTISMVVIIWLQKPVLQDLKYAVCCARGSSNLQPVSPLQSAGPPQHHQLPWLCYHELWAFWNCLNPQGIKAHIRTNIYNSGFSLSSGPTPVRFSLTAWKGQLALDLDWFLINGQKSHPSILSFLIFKLSRPKTSKKK